MPNPMPAVVTNTLRLSAVEKLSGSPLTVLSRAFKMDFPKVFPNIERIVDSTNM